MKTHKVKTVVIGGSGGVLTWCARHVQSAHATKSLTQVSCTICREKFAEHLRKLPDVLMSRHRAGTEL